MKSQATSPPSPIRRPQSSQTPSAELREGTSYAFDRATRMFVAKPATPPSESKYGARLATMLLPQVQSRWMPPMAAQMTPARIEQILRSALVTESPRAEQELYSLMEATWPRLLKNRMEVVDAVLGLDWQVMDAQAGENLPGAIELVRRTKNGMRGDPVSDGQGWRATLGCLLDAWFRGVSVVEIQWEWRPTTARHPGAWLPRQTFDVPPWQFGWRHDSGRLLLYPDGQPEAAVEFPEHKFLVAIRKAGKGHPSGTALLRSLAWWWCAANFSAEWLLNFAQIFGQPFRWATYDPSQEGVRDDLAEMMENMGSAAWGIGPDGTRIEWHEAAKGAADNPQSHMLALADTACDLLVLGQTLTTSQGDRGSQALGTVHQSVRADIIDSAALWLAEILNEQLISSIVAVNHGPTGEDGALPWLQPARKSKQDTKTVAETFEICLRSGIPLLKEEVYDALDLSMPEPGDDAFAAAPATPTAPDGGAPAAAAPPDLRRMLARLPIDAREYFMARLLDDPAAEHQER